MHALPSPYRVNFVSAPLAHTQQTRAAAHRRGSVRWKQQRHNEHNSINTTEVFSQTVKPLCAEIQLRVYARLKQVTRNAVGRRDVRAVSEVLRARVRGRSREAATTQVEPEHHGRDQGQARRGAARPVTPS